MTDALQEVTAELQAELKYWMVDSASAWDKCEENRVKLAKAVAELERLGFDFQSIVGRELKGQDDE